MSNKTIITKMMSELEKAKTHHRNVEQMKKHIAHVKLLCELLLEADQPQPEEQKSDSLDVSAQELKAMLGDTYAGSTKEVKSSNEKHKYHFHNEANGDSIFDF